MATMDCEQGNLGQREVSANMAPYSAGVAHASDASLERLLALTKPQKNWRMLDVTADGGRTALAFASCTEQVIACGLTLPMIEIARQRGSRMAAGNLRYAQVDAERLPFPAEAFECVTCRVAAHRFSNVGAFVSECARVLRSGGVLAVADNIVSGEPKVARFVNTFERLRDPSHSWAYALEDWETFFFSAGLAVVHRETVQKELDFDEWAARAGVSGADLLRLRVLLVQAPSDVRSWLQPRQVGAWLTFRLTEGIVIGRKE